MTINISIDELRQDRINAYKNYMEGFGDMLKHNLDLVEEIDDDTWAIYAGEIQNIWPTRPTKFGVFPYVDYFKLCLACRLYQIATTDGLDAVLLFKIGY